MSRRQHRVEELLRRELAQMLIHGELRDPRLHPTSAVGITGVEVSGDLGVAKIYVDVLTEALRIDAVISALQSGAGLIRSKLADRVQLRRMPELRFLHDQSIERGNRVEAILSELRDSAAVPVSEGAVEAAGEGEGGEDNGQGQG
ncbi:30S ribosome-binding factor RbfA [Pseudenhygromyxa sp. WMMC2535]|uniref:30S ribosome-binding factor RbfA n=1 Tax=Pseudenhygromyxa sp. WMMC2535 TaxID=2712867 RepID=UPI0015521174|nr:30S ribosome-binding factor RbfA [Pseudenhygromyxa sp. WMMC2535]NVB41571.1 30S ribosome-binding factor RbfA [Pseudenhygromyxa sp. WMMC2535]